MAQIIGITMEEFDTFQGDLTGLQEQVNMEMDRIKTLSEQVASSWKGDASEKFRTEFLAWKEKNMTQFNELMQEVQTSLTNYKKDMAERDAAAF